MPAGVVPADDADDAAFSAASTAAEDAGDPFHDLADNIWAEPELEAEAEAAPVEEPADNTEVEVEAEAGADGEEDGDDEANALTDGLLLIRYLFGFSGNSLTSGAVGEGAKRGSAERIVAYIEQRTPGQ